MRIPFGNTNFVLNFGCLKLANFQTKIIRIDPIEPIDLIIIKRLETPSKKTQKSIEKKIS